MLRFQTIFLCLLVGLSFSLYNCSKDRKIGKDVIDPNSLLNGVTTDTFELVTYTIEDDSIISSNPSNTVLGSYVDPKFGKMDASFYTQFRLAAANPNFGDVSTIVVDSFVLALKYVGFYGDQYAQNFEVHEMEESIYVDTTYYTFTSKAVKPTNLIPEGKRTISPRPLDRTVVGTDTVDAQLRIHIDTNLAKNLIQAAVDGSGTYASNEAFLQYFKGLYIKANNPNQSVGKGAVLYFNLNDAASKLTIYFRQAGESKRYDYLINSSCADFAHVEITNNGFPIQSVIQDTTQGLKEFYAQAFKHRAVVKIKHIDLLPKNTMIHRADLLLPVQYQTGNRFKPGGNVSVATKVKLTDKFFTGLGSLGEFSETSKHFKVDARNYAQGVINGDLENFGIVISPRFFVNSAERIVFNGKNTNNKNKPKLILTYTTF
jgi:hypothetical protein